MNKLSEFYILYEDGSFFDICNISLQLYTDSFRKIVDIKVNPMMQKIQFSKNSNIEGVEKFFNLDLELIIMR